MEIAQIYESTIMALGVMALLMLVQMAVADIVAIKYKHTPGMSVPESHESLLFRSSRTVANTNENIGIFLLVVLFCVFSHASPTWTAYASWAYVTTRLFYTLFYYMNLQILRSTTFVVSILCLSALLVIGFFT